MHRAHLAAEEEDQQHRRATQRGDRLEQDEVRPEPVQGAHSRQDLVDDEGLQNEIHHALRGLWPGPWLPYLDSLP